MDFISDREPPQHSDRSMWVRVGRCCPGPDSAAPTCCSRGCQVFATGHFARPDGRTRQASLSHLVLWRHNRLVGQPRDGSEQLNVPPAGKAEADTGSETGIMLAEYSALRAEVDRRANVQWNVFALQIGSAGVISSLAISSVSNIALLLLVPLSSYMLGGRYILHDYHIKLISAYIRDSLSHRLHGHLQWERWKTARLQPDVGKRRWFTVTGWNMLHPTRLAFEGVALLALGTSILAAAYAWRDNAPQWYLILGFALLWSLGATATSLLHISFDRASGT